jgi:hypothetical protein
VRPALLLSGYALAAAWWAPAPLSRLTARGVSPRLGLAAWLTAMASALASAAAALEFLVRAAADRWSRLAEVVCRSVAGPATALGAMACAVTARLRRLADAPRRARHARYGLALTAVMLLLAVAPGVLAVTPA